MDTFFFFFKWKWVQPIPSVMKLTYFFCLSVCFGHLLCTKSDLNSCTLFQRFAVWNIVLYNKAAVDRQLLEQNMQDRTLERHVLLGAVCCGQFPRTVGSVGAGFGFQRKLAEGSWPVVKSIGLSSTRCEKSSLLNTHSYICAHTFTCFPTFLHACTHILPHTPGAVVNVNLTSRSQGCGVAMLKHWLSPYCIPNTVLETLLFIACGPQNALQMSKLGVSNRESCLHRCTMGKWQSLIHTLLSRSGRSYLNLATCGTLNGDALEHGDCSLFIATLATSSLFQGPETQKRHRRHMPTDMTQPEQT